MAQIELQKIDAGTIREVFWFRENRKSVILLGQLARMFHGLATAIHETSGLGSLSNWQIIIAADWIFTP